MRKGSDGKEQDSRMLGQVAPASMTTPVVVAKPGRRVWRGKVGCVDAERESEGQAICAAVRLLPASMTH